MPVRHGGPDSVREGGENAIPKCDLSLGIESPVSEHSLVQFAWSTDPTAPVSEGKVVEEEEFTGLQTHLDRHGVDQQIPMREEARLVLEGRELGTAEERGIGADAGQDR